MIQLLNATMVFVLAFLGMISLAFLIVFVWLAYKYDISFSIRTREKETKAAESKVATDHDAVS